MNDYKQTNLDEFLMPLKAPITSQGGVSAYDFDSLNERASVTRSKLAANAIGTNQLGTLQITTTQIEDLAVTNAKLGNNSVTSSKIAGSAVDTSDINNSAITAIKIASGVIAGTHIGGSTIAGTHIALATVESTKIATGGTLDMASYKANGTAGVDGTIDTSGTNTFIIRKGIIVSVT